MKISVLTSRKKCPLIAWAIAALILSACSPAKAEPGDEYKHDASKVSSANNTYSWLKTDTSIALKKNDHVVWQFNFDKESDKPYFFPLRTANTLQELASLRPADHPWHRGLWFSWKLINKVNYWEEDFTTRLSPGRSIIDSVGVQFNQDFSAVISIKLSYGAAGKSTIISENRIIYVSAPDEAGNYYLDWDLKFKAGSEQLILDRTLPPAQGGPFYGGYAGLSIRASEALNKHRFVDSKGWKNTKEMVGHGKKAEWMHLSGVTDSAKGIWGGITIFDHPSNINSPTPWYVYKDKQFAFFNSALLFEKPLTLEPFEQMVLRYRVLIHEGRVREPVLSRKYKSFLARRLNYTRS
jgi:hypothetical protein